MPLTSAIHDSLPYIDHELSVEERADALSTISAELGAQPYRDHPSLPPLPTQHFSPLIEVELQRILDKQPLKAIDLSRYEALEPPATSPYSDERDPTSLIQWREALQKAYTSQSYLVGRQENLGQLEKFGKNAWLIGNSQLEGVLRQLEQELVERRTRIDMITIERKNAQETVKGELKGLDDTWKRGVGRILETEVAAESLRREILQQRREGVQ